MIYIILCSCPLLYVGKIKRAMHTRIVEHMSAIRRQDHTSPVFRHFESAKHYFSDFKFLGIERVLLHRRGGNRRKLLQREDFWVEIINPNRIKWRDGSCMFFVKGNCWHDNYPSLRSAVNNLQLCLYKCGVAFLPHELWRKHGLKRLLSGLFSIHFALFSLLHMKNKKLNFW